MILVSRPSIDLSLPSSKRASSYLQTAYQNMLHTQANAYFTLPKSIRNSLFHLETPCVLN